MWRYGQWQLPAVTGVCLDDSCSFQREVDLGMLGNRQPGQSRHQEEPKNVCSRKVQDVWYQFSKGTRLFRQNIKSVAPEGRTWTEHKDGRWLCGCFKEVFLLSTCVFFFFSLFFLCLFLHFPFGDLFNLINLFWQAVVIHVFNPSTC